MCASARAGGCAIGLLGLLVLGVCQGTALAQFAAHGDPNRGRELFEHIWEIGDSELGGDGIGPMFKERSCVACHFLGGIGGAGPAQNNVDLLTAAPPVATKDLLPL